MDKPLLIIDIDGVACDHARGICDKVNVDYNLKSKPSDVTTWNHNFGPIDFLDAVEKYYPKKDFILNLKVHAGFKKFVNSITDIVNIEFATNRKVSHQATENWINKKIGDFKVSFVKDKMNLQFDYLLEDYVETATKAAQEGRTAFVINRPWNSDEIKLIKKDKSLYFVKNYSEIITILNDIHKA